MTTRSVKDRTLTPEFLIQAYRNGFFPMAESRYGPITWHSPDPRAIIPIASFRPPRSLRRRLKQRIFDIRVDTVFADVIRACAARPETWISDEIIQAYTNLHRIGVAHSVEAWSGTLAGGLYGVSIGGAFFGESMFTRKTDASKVAFVYLVERLQQRGFLLLDTQFMNKHVQRLGAVEISREDYLELLVKAINTPTSFM